MLKAGDRCLVRGCRVSYCVVRVLVGFEEEDIVGPNESVEEIVEPCDLAGIDLAGAVGAYLLTTINVVLDSDVTGESQDFVREEEGPIHFAPGAVISTFDEFEALYPWDKDDIKAAREAAVDGSRHVARIPQSVITGQPSKDFLYLACQARDRVIASSPTAADERLTESESDGQAQNCAGTELSN